VPGEGVLDLAELDSEAADFHLVIEAAEELDVPIGEIAGEVARKDIWPDLAEFIED
jgi:hypothetical protein